MFYKYGEKDYELLFKKSRYSIEITNMLFNCGTMTHQKLSDKLGIKKNNLTNIVRKLDPFEILFVRKIGKNVFYSLNAKGVEFYKYIISQKEAIPEMASDLVLEFSGKKWGLND